MVARIADSPALIGARKRHQNRLLGNARRNTVDQPPASIGNRTRSRGPQDRLRLAICIREALGRGYFSSCRAEVKRRPAPPYPPQTLACGRRWEGGVSRAEQPTSGSVLAMRPLVPRTQPHDSAAA